jgi:hypothetical protein
MAKALVAAQNAIDLECISTWPKEIKDLLQAKLVSLRNYYERIRAHIDRHAEQNVRLQVNRPANPFDAERAVILARIERLLADEYLLGFHCTRLHLDELTRVRNEGLQPLSFEQLRARIEKRVEAGDIPPAVASRLLAENEANDDYRRGMIWFVNSRALLTDEAGCIAFFGAGVARRFIILTRTMLRLGPCSERSECPVLSQRLCPFEISGSSSRSAKCSSRRSCARMVSRQSTLLSSRATCQKQYLRSR